MKRIESINQEREKEYQQRIASNFKRMINVKNISNYDIAAQMGYSQASINHKINGRQNISCAFLLDFCERYSLPIEPFFAKNIEQYLLKKEGDKSEDTRAQPDLELFLKVKTNDPKVMKEVRRLLDIQ